MRILPSKFLSHGQVVLTRSPALTEAGGGGGAVKVSNHFSRKTALSIQTQYVDHSALLSGILQMNS